MWRKLGLQPDMRQVNLVKENRRKVRYRIEVIWQELRLVIMEAFENHAPQCRGASDQAGIGACHQYVPHHGAAAGAVTTPCHGSRVQSRILIS